MYRNTNTNHASQPTHLRDSRVLPPYQRLLTRNASDVYPYQTPPPQNGMVQPGLFLIDRGRKTIKIAGGSPLEINQPHQDKLTQPSKTQPTDVSSKPNTSGRRVSIQMNPEAPDTYQLLVQVLGDDTMPKTQTRTPPTPTTTAESRETPVGSVQATHGRYRANSTASSLKQSRALAASSSRMTQEGPQEMKRLRKSSSASEDFSNRHQEPVTVRTYVEHPGNASALRTPSHHQPTRNSSPATATQSQRDHRISNPQQSRLVDTPTTTKGTSGSSGTNRKRTHENSVAYTPSLKADTSNPTGKVLDRLSEAVWQNYVNSKERTDRLYLKERLRQTLESIIHTKYPGSMLFLVGSSLNGFATKHSDTDLCLMVSNEELSQKYHATQILNALHKLLLRRSNFVSEARVIYAKVPIIKFVCSNLYGGLDCDININNATGIRNTHLLQTYSKMDWRVAPLVVLIKQWASAQDINDASQGTLSSYSLALMVLNYLQVKCKPCVIPCLHQLHSSTFNSNSDVRFLYDTHPSNPLPSYITFKSDNTQTLWDLLRGFFNYYVEEFRFQTNVICVRLGTTYPLANASYGTREWINKYIYIEEPFDRNNTARTVFNDINFRKIMWTFEKTQRRLARSGNSHSDDPEEILNLRFEKPSRDASPVKKKKKR